MKNIPKIIILGLGVLTALAWLYSNTITELLVKWQNKKLVPVAEVKLFSESFVVSDEETNKANALKLMSRSMEASTETNSVDIDSCVPTPKSARVSYGKDLTFNNTGSESITVGFTRLSDLVVAPGQSVTINTKSISPENRKIGSFASLGYSCNYSGARVGYVVITD